MTMPPDFDFGFGKGRHLKGYGWRGLLALAMLLLIPFSMSNLGGPLLDSGARFLRMIGLMI